MGLDPKVIKELKKIFFELKASGVSSISTHILESVEDLWEQAMIMQDGELRSVVTHNELTAQGTNLTDYFFTVTEVKPEEVEKEQRRESNCIFIKMSS